MTACPRCGSPARQTYIILTFADGCERIPAGVRCTNDDCIEAQAVERAAEQKRRDEAAIAEAIEQGLIDP